MTATPTRKDGHHPIINMQCGPIRFCLSARSMAATSPFQHRVVPVLTDFALPDPVSSPKIHEVYATLIEDDGRNQQIVSDLIAAVEGAARRCF